MMSTPLCFRPPLRGACHVSPNQHRPWIGKTLNDTPITMVRNEFVKLAKREKCDILVMVDSDQRPDMFLRQDNPEFTPGKGHRGNTTPCLGKKFSLPWERVIHGLQSFLADWTGNNGGKTVVPASVCGNLHRFPGKARPRFRWISRGKPLPA